MRRRRFLSPTWLAVLAGAILAVAAAMPVEGGPVPRDVFVDEPNPDPGQAFNVSITGCIPGELVPVDFAGSTMNVVSNLDGEATLALTAPAVPDVYDGFVTCNGVTTNFVVNVSAPPAPPGVTVDDPNPAAGATFGVAVAGCLPGDAIEVQFAGATSAATADAAGNAALVLTAPSDPGAHDGSVTCGSGTTNFAVTVPAPDTTEAPPTDPEPTDPDPAPTPAPDPEPAPSGTTTTTTTTVAPVPVTGSSDDGTNNALLIAMAIGVGVIGVGLVGWMLGQRGRGAALH